MEFKRGNFLKSLKLKYRRNRQHNNDFYFLPVFSAQFKPTPLLAISARVLKEALQVDEDFDFWINNIINEYRILQGYEYLFVDFMSNLSLKNNQFDYDIYLSISTAKLICAISKTNLSLEVRNKLVITESYLNKMNTYNFRIKYDHFKHQRLENIQCKALVDRSWHFTILYLDKFINSGEEFSGKDFYDIAYSLNKNIRNEITSDVGRGYKNIKIRKIRNWKPMNDGEVKFLNDFIQNIDN